MRGGEENARWVTERESEMRGRRKSLGLLERKQSTLFLERNVRASLYSADDVWDEMSSIVPLSTEECFRICEDLRGMKGCQLL
jgi:hypothetical protein